jgi:uncharacterized YccA/Bax inhibitor family protein
VIKVSEKFKLGVVAATGGIAVFYLAQFALGFLWRPLRCHLRFWFDWNRIQCGGVIVASLNLVLDFDFIESGVRAGAPKYYGVVRSLWPDG